MLEALAADAAQRINSSLAHFNNHIQIVPSVISADDLLLQIGVHSRDFETAKTIREYLVQFGSIAAGATTERIARALRRLSEHGVLEYRADAGQGGNYVVTASYRAALEELRQRETLPRLAA